MPRRVQIIHHGKIPQRYPVTATVGKHGIPQHVKHKRTGIPDHQILNCEYIIENAEYE